MDPYTAITLFNALKGMKTNAISGIKQQGADATALTGGLVSSASLLPGGDINVGQASIGGALQGLAAGAGLGPIGALFGGLAGGIGGYGAAASQKENYEESQRRQRQNQIINSTVEPFGGYFAEGGDVQSILELVGIQTEVGEKMLLPNGDLVDVSADKTHKQMDKDQVTDFVPESTIIFSERDKIDPKKLTKEQDFMGYGVAKYEEGATTQKIERFNMSDILGTKKLSFANAADKIKKHYKANNSNDDILTEVTNLENKTNRTVLMKKLADLQDPESQRGLFAGGTPSKGVSQFDDIFNTMLGDLDQQETQNAMDFNEGQQQYSDLNRSIKNNNRAHLATQLLGNLSQNVITEPAQRTFSANAFQTIPNSLIDSQANQIRSGADSLARQLLNSGMDPKLVASVVGSAEGQSANAEGQLRMKSILDTRGIDNQKFAALNTVRDYNSAARTEALNATETDLNKKKSIMARDAGNFLESASEIDSRSLSDQRQVEAQFNAARQNIDASRRQAEIARLNFNILDNYYRQRLASLTGATGAASTTEINPSKGVQEPSTSNVPTGMDTRPNGTPPQFDERSILDFLDLNQGIAG